MRHPEFIGAASGLGAPDKRCADGPLIYAKGGLLSHQRNPGIPTGINLLFPQHRPAQDLTETIASFCGRLKTTVSHTVYHEHFPIVLGGDHSCAIGTWSGVHEVIDEPFGLIWIDAHMDSHIPDTSPSHALHGMPLASLLGLGDQRLTRLNGLTPSLVPENVCLYGVRSYEADEEALLKELGVRVITMDEIKRDGAEATWAEALQIVKRNTNRYGISIDLDALDPKDAPGIGSPEPGGLRRDELLTLIFGVKCDPALLALEIAEFNPYLDRNGLTLTVIEDLIDAVLDQEICYGQSHHA